jgi:hypothetical protein
MARICSICTSPEHPQVNQALVACEPLRAIAQRLGVSVSALHRHKKHLPEHFAKAKEAGEALDAGKLIAHLQSLRNETLEILATAKKSGDSRTMLAAIGRAENQLRLVVEMISSLQSKLGQVRVIRSLRDLQDEELEALIAEGRQASARRARLIAPVEVE